VAAIACASKLGALRTLARVAAELVFRALFTFVADIFAGIHLANTRFTPWWASLAT